MRKALLPMIASLALCGAATIALIATTARAEQSGRRPVMIALMTPGTAKDRAAPPAEGGPPPAIRDGMLRDGMVGPPRQEQLCRDLYAGKAGELAFLEAKLGLDAKQAPLFARWKQASLDIAKQHEGECAGKQTRAELRGNRRGMGPNVVERMSLEEDMLKKRLADIETERPALTALYNALTPAQKEELSRGDMRRMPLHMMLGMMDRPRPGMMRQGPMTGPMGGPTGPMGQPPEPSPAQ